MADNPQFFANLTEAEVVQWLRDYEAKEPGRIRSFYDDLGRMALSRGEIPVYVLEHADDPGTTETHSAARPPRRV